MFYDSHVVDTDTIRAAFKLPLLVKHYIIHQEQDNVSLFTFLIDHYSTNHNDRDLPEDEQLPFKNITFYSIGYAIVTSVIQAHVLAPLPSKEEIIFSGIYTHSTSIFHPRGV